MPCSAFPRILPDMAFYLFFAYFFDLAIYLRFWGKNRPNAWRFLHRSLLGGAFTLPTVFFFKTPVVIWVF